MLAQNFEAGILPKESGKIYARAAGPTGQTAPTPIVALFFKSPGDFAAEKPVEDVISSARFSPR